MFLLLAYLVSRCIKLSHWTPSRLYGGTVSPPAQGSLQACPTKAGLPALRFHFWRVPSRIGWVVCPFDLPQAKQGWFLVQSPFLKGKRAICPHLWLGNLPKSSLFHACLPTLLSAQRPGNWLPEVAPPKVVAWQPAERRASPAQIPASSTTTL